MSEGLQKAQRNSEDAGSISSLESVSSERSNLQGHEPQQITEDNEIGVEASRRSSTISRVLTFDKSKIVPRGKRRGLLANFSLVPEYSNPRELPNKVKYSIVFVVACCAIAGPMGTSILLPAIDDVARSLHTSEKIVNISVGIYLLTLGICPLWWSSFSERHGRRSIYLISFGLLLGFTIGNALSTSIGMLIGFRVLSGASSASVQAVGAGTIGDLYPPAQRGRALGVYYLGPLCGPLFAPIIGGALNEGWGWRATQWFLVIFSALCLLLLVFVLPETLRLQDNKDAVRDILRSRLKKNQDTEAKVESTSDDERVEKILSRLSRQPSQVAEEEGAVAMGEVAPESVTSNSVRSGKFRQIDRGKLEKRVSQLDSQKLTKAQMIDEKFKIYCYGPAKSLVFFRYTPVSLAVAYSSISFCILYFVNMTLTYAYSRPPYNFSSVLVGLVYIPNSITYIIASIWGGRWVDHLLAKYKEKHGTIVPEARIGANVWLAAGIFPFSLLIIGWCLGEKKHWVTPLIGTALFGFASMMVIGATVTYLVDSLPGRGATGVALNNFVRMILATVATFVTEPLIDALGIGVLFSILAGIIAVIPLLLVILKWKGDYYRETYDLEKLYDIVDD
ncbi:unnamed protein product [Kuraishia capsulata CBS 1993]|uniref:Major facilitator superfamily (MFS) profile domain-containing protein n=1 Tax=Kuraishia capsulata CBS 1993 TaxID=1382522 RepID=W6MX95_9ASCO|nr:uncharacterized protein KUCA_T00004483001 [Kuraishia capsulata CBS 1993]CDK28500.1 unnamed protein product [Kuraishia capsulata CBS 1993]